MYLRLSMVVLIAACKAPTAPPTTRPPIAKKNSASTQWPSLAEQIEASTVVSAPPGEDDGSTQSMIASTVDGTYKQWESIPAPEGAHPVVCDIAWFGDAVWASFGNKTISTDGALVYSWKRERGWKLEFNWDRGGAPGVTHEQGGQGISRLRVLGGRLHATDADAPNFAGFGLLDTPLEGYVFTAGADGFGSLEPGQLPPKDTLLVAFAFHVFDITQYKGRLVAAGGTLAPANSKGRYPGGLFVDVEKATLWPRFFPGRNAKAGVVRATFLHRFRGRLYVGFQNNEKRMKWDLGVVDGDPALAETKLVLGRVTEGGGWKTRHFASDAENLYWIASDSRNRGRSAIFHSEDGLQFSRLQLGAGEPHDALAAGGRALVLADRGLYRFQHGRSTQVLAAPSSTPFKRRDGFCSAPMTATPLGLVAGSTNGKGLFLAAPDPET